MLAYLRKLLGWPPAADTAALQAAIAKLNAVVPLHQKIGKHEKMSSPTGFVQLLQSDLDHFTAEITAATSVIASYIAKLVAGQNPPLPAADEAALTAAVTALQTLEPPTPSP